MFEDLIHTPESWSKALSSRTFRNQLAITLLVFGGICLHNFHYLRVWQARPGIQINDFLLNQMPPVDFSWAIFVLEYFTLLLVFLFTVTQPDRLVKGVQMFGLIILARTMSVYFFALESPKDMTPLLDPVANFFLHSKDTFVTKDLFFSGHVSALALLMLITVNKYVKRWALLATTVVSVLILWQHVHYSMDVFVAPLVSFVAYKFVLYIHRETRYGLELAGQEW